MKKTNKELIEDAWDWIKPYFVANGVCYDSIESLKENFIHRMNLPHLKKIKI